MLQPLQIPPGHYRAGTEYQSRGRWYDGSLVRFYGGTIQPVGGWLAINSSPLTGRPCATFTWRPNSVSIGRYLAVGTNSNAYAYDGSVTTDITPGDLTAGTADATTTQGYGAGNYSDGTYGTARTGIGGLTPVDAWHFDAWGEYLVGCLTSDGRLLEWDLNVANNLAVIANAPTQCKGLVVTAERMLMALGASGDVRSIAWSDTEDNTTWTPASSNTAGSLPLTTDGKIVTGMRVRGGILVNTDIDAHLVSYVGNPFIYGVERIADNCGIVSANAKIATAAFAVWMSTNGFYIYDGHVRTLPCDVQDYVFANLNKSQASKVAALHNGEWGEIWWFYPHGSSNENNRYVVWNYRENHWTIGALSRTAGSDRGAFDFPIMTDADGYWYEHENGDTANGNARGEYLTSGPVELVPGERLVWLNQVLFDETGSTDNVQFTIGTRFTPEGEAYSFGPYLMENDSGYTDVRAQGRHYTFSFTATEQAPWRLGDLRVDVQAAGRR